MSKIRRYLLYTLLLTLWGCASAQKVKLYDSTTQTENKVVYTLPLTELYLLIESEVTEETPGPLALYAEQYLGTTGTLLEPATHYRLRGIKLESYGVPDTEQRYTIDINSRSNATSVALTEDGILVGINCDHPEVPQLPTTQRPAIATGASTSSIPLPPEYIHATSDATRAKVLAQEIYDARDSRNLVISGESEQPFADGEALRLALERLDKQEKAFTELFNGTKKSAVGTELVMGISATKEGRSVVARFSKQLGLLPADDLRGAPIYLDLKVTEKADELDERATKKLEKRLQKGVVYRVPGRAKAVITYQGKVLSEVEIAVGQLGSLEALDMVLFRTKGKRTEVQVYPSNGGLQSIQERDI